MARAGYPFNRGADGFADAGDERERIVVGLSIGKRGDATRLNGRFEIRRGEVLEPGGVETSVRRERARARGDTPRDGVERAKRNQRISDGDIEWFRLVAEGEHRCVVDEPEV